MPIQNTSVPFRPIHAPEHVDVVSLSKASGKGESNAVFSDLFQQSVARVDQLQKDAREVGNSFLKGEDREVHEVVLAGQRAELAFDYFLQVRNKVVQAYQEVMRMQL